LLLFLKFQQNYACGRDFNKLTGFLTEGNCNSAFLTATNLIYLATLSILVSEKLEEKGNATEPEERFEQNTSLIFQDYQDANSSPYLIDSLE
jgi:hypothetical protein